MALNYKYDNADEIPAALKAEYKERDGAWYLDVAGAEDTGALRRSLDHVRAELKEAKKAAGTLQAEKDAADMEKAKATGDLAAVTAAWEKRVADMEKAQREQAAAAERVIKQSAVKETAARLAGEISTVPALMQRAIADRLTADVVDGVAIVRVLDAHGKATASGLEDLRRELVASPDYAAIIVKSKATGGGAGSGSQQSGSPGSAGPKRIAEMTELERREFYNRDRDAFNAQRKAEAAATTA